VDASAILASAEERVIDEALAALAQRDRAPQPHHLDERRRDLRQLFRLVLRCVHEGRPEPIVRSAEQIAAQVYERVQALRREAYDSSDYLEGLSASAEKRQPIFQGT
jgi:hypothetical protein